MRNKNVVFWLAMLNVVFWLAMFIVSVMILGSCSEDKPDIPKVTSIEIEHMPTKVEYYVGEDFDVSGLTLKTFYSDGASKISSVKKEQVTGFSSATPNANLILEIKEAEFVVLFSVKILTNIIQSIQLKNQPTKIIYTLDEPISLEGAILEVVYENGTTKVITSISADMVKGFDSSKPSPQLSLQISMDGKEVSFDVTILPFKVVNNEIVSSIASSITSLTIPDGITSIKAAAFFNNATIKEVIFPATIKSIGDNAFNFCVNLRKVDLSKTSISILPNGIFDRSGLVTVLLPLTLKRVGSQSLSNTKALKMLILPEGVEEIGTTAFSGSGLETITIPNTVCYMERAFYNCTQLRTIKTDGGRRTTSFDKTTAIQGECFNHCPNIEILEIPESITTIGITVLGACKVKTLILPQSVKRLEHNAFGNASSLEELTLESTTKVEAAYYPVPSTIKAIKVPQTLVDTYKQDEYWKAFAAKITAL